MCGTSSPGSGFGPGGQRDGSGAQITTWVQQNFGRRDVGGATVSDLSKPPLTLFPRADTMAQKCGRKGSHSRLLAGRRWTRFSAVSEPQSAPPFPRAMALLVAGAFFMEILYATIITPAIPLIASSPWA